LSLNHLARGVQIVTGCEPWEATAMAIGLDLLIVGLECAMVVTARTRAYRPVARFANPALIVAFLWSAGLNAFAFSAASAVLWMTVVAATLGASIHALIYAYASGRKYPGTRPPTFSPATSARPSCSNSMRRSGSIEGRDGGLLWLV
jgi:hypothetical protein